MDLKNLLKKIKLNENRISAVLGVIVVVITAVLSFNYFKDRNAQLTPAGNTEETNYERVHTVEKGESLWTISEKYYESGYNWVDVASKNGLKDYSLEVGQKLNIPNAEIKTVNGQPEELNALTYSVEKGDSLWSISVKVYGDGYRWSEIAKLNGLSHPNVIHTGNVLKLPK